MAGVLFSDNGVFWDQIPNINNNDIIRGEKILKTIHNIIKKRLKYLKNY